MSEAVAFTEDEIRRLEAWRDEALRIAGVVKTDFAKSVARSRQTSFQRALRLHLRHDHECKLPESRTLEAFHDDLHGK